MNILLKAKYQGLLNLHFCLPVRSEKSRLMSGEIIDKP
jgi:hypothetical protein